MGNLTSMHALSYFCLSLLDYLIQVMVFYKMDCAFFNDTSFMSTQSFVLFVAYWHAFDIAWPKQKPMKDCSSYKGAHVIIEDSVVARVLGLKLSSLTYAIALSINWNFPSKGFTSSIKVAPSVLGALNKPIVTCFGTQCSSLKFITNANVSKHTFPWFL